MKKFLFPFAAVVLLCATVFSSCNKGSTEVYGNGIATVKDGSDGYYVLQIDEKTVLVPETKTVNPFGTECRAFCSFIDKGAISTANSLSYRKVQVTGLSKILTKEPAPDMGELNDQIYGHDPVGMYDDWMTNVEDGYLTIHFNGRWGTTGVVHTINLVKGTDPADPLFFELRHNYNGDPDPLYYRDGIVAFKIRDLLPTTTGETLKIKVKYLSERGENLAVFNYTPGGEARIGTSDADIITSAPVK